MVKGCHSKDDSVGHRMYAYMPLINLKLRGLLLKRQKAKTPKRRQSVNALPLLVLNLW